MTLTELIRRLRDVAQAHPELAERPVVAQTWEKEVYWELNDVYKDGSLNMTLLEYTE